MKKNIYLITVASLLPLISLRAGIPREEMLKLPDFTVIQNTSKIDIKWTIAPADKGSYFTVEKSRDGKMYSKVIDMPAPDLGLSYADYFETDYQPFTGVSYYRIKQTDEKGNTKFSDVVTVKFNDEQVKLNSPENAQLAGNMKGKDVLVVLRDAEGKDVFSVVQVIEEENKIIAINPYPDLASGSYMIVGASNDKLVRHQVIIR